MKVFCSTQCAAELASYRKLGAKTELGLREAFRRLALEIDEFEGSEGWSIRAVQHLKRLKIPVFRAKSEAIIPGLRILFFPLPGENAIFITGIHARTELGAYDATRPAIVRAWNLWMTRGTNARDIPNLES